MQQSTHDKHLQLSRWQVGAPLVSHLCHVDAVCNVEDQCIIRFWEIAAAGSEIEAGTAVVLCINVLSL